MFKRFIHGLLFGAGFALAFVLVWTLWYSLVLPRMFESMTESFETELPRAVRWRAAEDRVASPPPLADRKEYLGTSGMFRGEFDRGPTLESGDARISGQVSTPDGPVEGLRLRLALNGSVFSEWATSGADGRYHVSVPPGDYRIDGFELDTTTAHRVLPGRIESPRNRFMTRKTFAVSAQQPGHGLDLRFVDPLIKTGPFGSVPLSPDLALQWQAHPGAESYEVQLLESSDPADVMDREPLFPWADQPEVIEPRLVPSEHGVTLKPGRHYSFNVDALDGQRRRLSRSPGMYSEIDFTVTGPAGAGQGASGSPAPGQ